LIALAYRPELLLLDEPSSGLDPVVRRDILEAIIRTVADEGRTVFFSSHLLEEVERVADDVAMMFNGQMVLAGALDDVKDNHHRLVSDSIRRKLPRPKCPGVLSITGAARNGRPFATANARRPWLRPHAWADGWWPRTRRRWMKFSWPGPEQNPNRRILMHTPIRRISLGTLAQTPRALDDHSRPPFGICPFVSKLVRAGGLQS
jgi:hypothetical protein